ncbi:MAG TPA: beta-phosphoglucomutase, partial [Allocoleopsis sp.]
MDRTPTSSNLVYTDWIVSEPHFNPEQLHTRETVFTIGNGYLSSRGSFEEGMSRAVAVTLIHGVYDEVPIVYTELANCPDWLPLSISVEGERFQLAQGELLSYERQLDLRRGVLSRSLRWRSPKGKVLDLRFERFASLADTHVLAVRCQITPINFSGSIKVQASINGYAENQGFNHWERLDQGEADHSVWLQTRTRSSHIELGMAFQLHLTGTEADLEGISTPAYPTLETTFSASLGQTITLEKLVTVFTSREVEQPVVAAQTKLQTLTSYTDLLAAHEQAWEQVWQRCDIVIEGDNQAQVAVRYNLFQLLIAAPWQDDRVSIPAKTLSGFGYRGHVFWDTEIFLLPFFTYTQPEVARNLLTYRYHTLDGARRKAKNYGYKGAMFAWESADTGDEVTPRWAIPNDPYAADVRIWCRDREVHISAMIAYAAWNYWLITQDNEWLRDYGAPVILESAVFWSSRVELNAKAERYEIRDVIGPDEYHEYVHNNAFTNRMVQWHLEKALAVYDWLQAHY